MMFRRGFYFSELIPLLLAIALLGLAVFGLATGRVPSVGGIGLGIVSLRGLRGY
jgi:hypothetical protein